LAVIVVVGEEIQSVWDAPAFANVGTSFTSIVIVEILDAQGELEIVHWKTFVPIAKPVIVELGKVGEVIVPEPETSVHNPVPTVGVLAVIVVVGEEIQSVWDAPAFANVGTSFTSMVIVETLGAQGELEIVQAKTFVPIAKPVIVETGEVGEVIVPLPETSVHKPVPTVGVFAVIVVAGDEIQSVCEAPALAVVGMSFTTIPIVEDEFEQGEFEITHSKTFVPKAKPVIVVFGEVGEVIVPLPETNTHKPVPTAGVLAAIVVVGDEIQIV